MEIKLFREFSFIACLTAKTPISFLFCPNFFNPLNTRSEQTIYSTWKAISLIIWSLKKTRRHHYCLLLFPLPEYSNLTDGVQQSLAQKKKENSGENIFFCNETSVSGNLRHCNRQKNAPLNKLISDNHAKSEIP